MWKLLFAALLLFASTGAWADMYPDASNAKLPGARTNLGGGVPVSIKDYGAKADAVTRPDGVMAAGGTTLTSAAGNFTAADVGKLIQVDGAAGVWLPPLRTTISAVTDAHTAILASPATKATPRRWLSAAYVATPRTVGNYVPGDLLTLQGGTYTTQAVVKVVSTTVLATGIVAGGTGGIAGSCRVQGTTGSGTLVQQDVTISGGAITAVGYLQVNGHYFAKPTNIAVEPVTNAPGFSCAPTGATLALTMGVDQLVVTTRGDYDPNLVPADPIATSAGSISGATGATVNSGGLPYGAFNPTGAFVYGSDDSLPLKDAIDAATDRFVAGKPGYVFVPAGNYLIDAVPTPIMRAGLGIIGEGTSKTNIVLGANYVGDLFSWTEVWGGFVAQLGGTMAQVNTNYSAPKAIGFSVWGNRAAAAQQNGLMFYDRVDAVFIDDVHIAYINGRCMQSGMLKEQVQAYMRESYIGRFSCNVAGATGIPAVEFGSEGSGDATDEININDMNIYANQGDGLVFRSDNTVDRLRAIRINKLRIEGQQFSEGGDLLRLGGPGNNGPIFGIYINQMELLTPYPNKAAMRVTGPADIYFIKVESGTIGSGVPMGYGLVLEAGRSMNFYFSQIYTWNTNLTTSGIFGSAVVDGDGGEAFWTYQLANPFALVTPFRRSSSVHPGGAMITSCAGMPAGTLWNDAGTVKVC